LFIFLTGSYYTHAQKEKNVVDMVMECYEEYYALNKQGKVVCPPEPDGFHNFFGTDFIGFAALREGGVKTFSFSDNLGSPLKRDLIVTSRYGMREAKKHFGVDFRLDIGDTVCSIFCGKVRIAKWDDSYGYVVVVRHYNMSETVYAHLDKILVTANQEVAVGDPVGLGGNTGISSGPHLHFELRYKGFPIDPIIMNKFLTLIQIKYK
jgi:murein DD-endopeptidase MepM/ murein hydrolase activator NlpD